MESSFNKVMKGILKKESSQKVDSESMSPKIEGTLYYKGFRAQYWRGDEESEESEYYVGEATNLRHVIFVLEGTDPQEITDDFHGMVEDFLENLQNPQISNPIEFYTDDPAILEYYRLHYPKPVLPSSVNFGIQDIINIHKEVYSNQELALAG
jgi:hypothetical protein